MCFMALLIVSLLFIRKNSKYTVPLGLSPGARPPTTGRAVYINEARSPAAHQLYTFGLELVNTNGTEAY